MVSGSDDQLVLVWDKQTTQLLEELKGHDAQVSRNSIIIKIKLFRDNSGVMLHEKFP